MKKLLLAALIACSGCAYGQDLIIKSQGVVSDTIVTIMAVGWSSSHEYQMVYMDTTCPNFYNATLYSYHNKDYVHDTEFVYNHLDYLRGEFSRKEDSVYQVRIKLIRKMCKTQDAVKSVSMRLKIDELEAEARYYRGKYDLLSELLYHYDSSK